MQQARSAMSTSRLPLRSPRRSNLEGAPLQTFPSHSQFRGTQTLPCESTYFFRYTQSIDAVVGNAWRRRIELQLGYREDTAAQPRRSDWSGRPAVYRRAARTQPASLFWSPYLNERADPERVDLSNGEASPNACGFTGPGSLQEVTPRRHSLTRPSV